MIGRREFVLGLASLRLPREPVLPCRIRDDRREPEMAWFVAAWSMGFVPSQEYLTPNRRSGHCASRRRARLSRGLENSTPRYPLQRRRRMRILPLPPVVPISEDCLQLNVWAPPGPGPYPVFVWIYGGGNHTGASNQPVYQGEKFARDGVICVTFNYRVGVWGFLELGGITGAGEAGSGNNALRDQILALQWVQENIAAFGGDPRTGDHWRPICGSLELFDADVPPFGEGLFHAGHHRQWRRRCCLHARPRNGVRQALCR